MVKKSKTNTTRKRKPRKTTVKAVKAELPEVKPDDNGEKPKEVIKKKVTAAKLLFLIAAIICCALGLIVGYFYYTEMEIWQALVAVFFIGSGIFSFSIYRRKPGGEITTYLGDPVKQQVNSLCFYPHRMLFEDVLKPEGIPWQCDDDKKYYYLNIFLEKRLRTLVLPDQQIMSPEEAGQRLLTLPAHKRLFRRRDSIINAIKIGALLIGMLIVWILIITTTGESEETTAWLPILVFI